jgi:hypothetical protein
MYAAKIKSQHAYQKVIFADDTWFGYSNQDTVQLKNVIAHDLNEMDIWSKNGLCHLILTKQKS